MKTLKMLTLFVLWTAGTGMVFGADTNLPSNALVNDTFDEWEWQPILDSMKREGRKVLEAGGELAYEYQGPLFRLPRGFFLPAGRMVEGPEAYKGRSMLIDASRGRWEIGMHDHYGNLFEPGRTYTYEVALKGKGTFVFQGWVNGVNPATAEYKWLDFPAFIVVSVTNEWKVYAGSIMVKKYDDTPFGVGKIGAAIVVNPKDVIYVDNFRISK